RRVNAWRERRVDLDEGLHALGHHWKTVLACIILLKLAAWTFSGLYAIQENEIGIVRRFGRALPDDLTPGLHWRWPWPVETVTRVQPQRIYTLEIGFRIEPGSKVALGPRSWSTLHGGLGMVRSAAQPAL